MRRFYIPAGQVRDEDAFIEGSDIHHIVNVLRKGIGDEIDATDGQGNVLKAKIISIQEHKIFLKILEKIHHDERKIFLRLYQAIPKGSLFENILEKVSELGVDEIIPIVTERSIIHYHEERGLKKMARWERIVLEAMKKTGRVSAPVVRPVLPIRQIAGLVKPGSLKVMPWELEDSLSLKSLMQKNPDAVDLELIIGPEGGFSLGEAEFLKSIGFQSVTLGKRILKVETAAIVTIGNIYYSLE